MISITKIAASHCMENVMYIEDVPGNQARLNANVLILLANFMLKAVPVLCGLAQEPYPLYIYSRMHRMGSPPATCIHPGIMSHASIKTRAKTRA